MTGRAINKKDGFTIIEVVLVLAIAGLVFVASFLALPALQRAQRDNHRKNDVALTVAAVKNFMIDNKNKVPQHSGTTDTGDSYDIDGDGEISPDEAAQIWQDGNPSTELAPYLKSVYGSGVTTSVSVYDATSTSSLLVTVGNSDQAGLITVFLGAQCPTEYPRPDIMKMKLTKRKNDVAVFRYLEGGKSFCEDF